MRRNLRAMAVVAVSSLVLALSACGGGDEDNDEDNGTTGGSIAVNSCNPLNSLIPANTSEVCGGNVLDVATARLMRYEVDDATPEYDIAESIDTADNQAFTVKLKKDYRFSDGTPVLARNFVDAWNFAAYGPNDYEASYFFEPIEGWDQLQCTGAADNPCAKPADQPKVTTLSGLRVVDDLTFTIKTTSKVSNLAARLGYMAFSPMPDSFFEDPKAYGLHPVTAGPYAVDHWTEHEEIVLKKNPHYSGAFGGKLDQISFKIYTDPREAYADARDGSIDLTDTIPPRSLTNKAWTQDFPGRTFSREAGAIQTIGMNPTADPGLADVRIRKAISMAIDRDTIVKEVFAGSREPATGWVPPAVDGYRENQCGAACTYDPVEAKRLFDAAGGYPGNKLTVAYNADSEHKDWIEAACDSIKKALKVGCEGKAYDDFATLLAAAEKGQVKGLFREAWRMDYPNIENFLTPVYAAGAASNYYGPYRNPEFEKLLEEAAAAPDVPAANALYQDAEAILAADFPTIPLWYHVGHVAWSERIDDVTLNAFGVPDYANITVK